MKKLLIPFLFLIIGCYQKPYEEYPDSYFVDFHCLIMEKAGYVNDHGKFTCTGKYFFIRGIEDTTVYWEYQGIYGYLPDSVYYNYKVGDTLHFDYIRKNHFFHIKSK